MEAGLRDKHVLITSGPTRAALDAVRFIGNRSSGRLGCRIAREALRLGARVTLLAGPQSEEPAPEARLRLRRVETVADLLAALEEELCGAAPPDAVVHAMAVLDYVPEAPRAGKTPSGAEEWCVRLVRTPKVVQSIRAWAPRALLVSFKLEVGIIAEEELRQAALASLRAHGADLVVANDMEQIRGEAHPALILAPDGAVCARPGTKDEIARELCRLLAERLA